MRRFLHDMNDSIFRSVVQKHLGMGMVWLNTPSIVRQGGENNKASMLC